MTPLLTVPLHDIVTCTAQVRYNGQEVLVGETRQLRSTWEDTSFKLELLQSNSCTVEQEASGLLSRNGPSYKVSFNPDLPSLSRHSESAAVVLETFWVNGTIRIFVCVFYCIVLYCMCILLYCSLFLLMIVCLDTFFSIIVLVFFLSLSFS